jgi:hypothetical protein
MLCLGYISLMAFMYESQAGKSVSAVVEGALVGKAAVSELLGDGL